MPNIVRVHDDALLARHTVILTQGATSGRFVSSVPFPADYVAILNQTEATIYFVEGEQYSQSPEVTPVEPGGYISTRIRETQKVTCFWSSTSALPAGATATLVFSNEPIPLQAGNLTPNATTSNVAVTNTPTVNVNTLPSVNVASLPALPAGANAIGTVGVTSLPSVKEAGDSFVNYSTAQAGVQVKTGAGTLKKVVINNPGSAMTISLYDGTSATNPIANIAAAFGTLDFNVSFATGLYVVIGGTTIGDVTISYQ